MCSIIQIFCKLKVSYFVGIKLQLRYIYCMYLGESIKDTRYFFNLYLVESCCKDVGRLNVQVSKLFSKGASDRR